MTALADDIRELTAPDDIRGYFAQFSEILGHLAAINRRERSTAVRDAHEGDIILGYLSLISGTMLALGMKYGFAGFVHDRLPSDLQIDVRDSGFPSATEIRRLEQDLARSLDPAAAEPDLRAEMVDYILTNKRPPRDLQFRQSQRAYQAILRREKLFTTRVEPTVVMVEGGPQRAALVHWAVYDNERNHPLVYIMVVEDSGQKPLDKDPERLASFKKSCLAHSQSSLTLLTIATQVDEAFVDLHPKSLKRVVVGPMYSSRFTEVAEAMGKALSPFRDDWRVGWVFGWTVESLRSKGSRKVSTGMFGTRLLESFDVDPKDSVSIRTGTTESHTRAVMPYDVFQAIQHLPDNPLNDIPKYVIDRDGHVAFHM